MRKLLSLVSSLLVLVLLFSISTLASSGEDEYILMDYPTNNPITYHGTNDPVYLPSNFTPNKQEFRAAWVTTIWNLDVPQYASNHEAQFKAYHLQLFDNLEAYNFNAVIYQIRPKNDAFYQSNLNPWSRFLTGTEGVNPGWDPLEWLIDEAHRRGLEFHAWFNPYRVFLDSVAANNIVKLHPEYVIKLGNGNDILNPGLPQVQQFIVDTVVEVAENYDIDAVHFDDYFYPYGGLNSRLDRQEYRKYNPNKLSLDDWRRENVNIVIRDVKQALTMVNQQQGKSIQFGVSPFGVWRTYLSTPEGSRTPATVESYSELYADSKRWIEEEWVDYIMPQLYYEFDYYYAPYADILDWWANVVDGTDVNLYIGQGIYRYVDPGDSGVWEDPNEIPNQLLYNSKYDTVKGSAYFRYNFLLGGNANAVYAQNELKTRFYNKEVLPPAVKNLDAIVPHAPQNLNLSGNTLTWNSDADAKAYYVYRFDANATVDLNDLNAVLDIVWNNGNSILSYVDTTYHSGVSYQYYVTAFDRANNESLPQVVYN